MQTVSVRAMTVLTRVVIPGASVSRIRVGSATRDAAREVPVPAAPPGAEGARLSNRAG